eukprot:510251_1
MFAAHWAQMSCILHVQDGKKSMADNCDDKCERQVVDVVADVLSMNTLCYEMNGDWSETLCYERNGDWSETLCHVFLHSSLVGNFHTLVVDIQPLNWYTLDGENN